MMVSFVVLVSSVSWSKAGTIIRDSLTSSIIKRDYFFTIYLPEGYQDSTLRYPVLYLLHGSKGDETDWLVKGRIQATLDRLIQDKRLPPVIAVMPGHKAMWWDDAQAEPAESVLLRELLPTIQSRFRTLDSRDGRAFIGPSAGGYATIRLALRYPELFAAGAALSPAIYEPLPPVGSSALTDPPFQKNGAFDRETWIRHNWRASFDAYLAQPLRVALYINSGDRDRFDIAYHAAVFHHALRAHQPELTAFRVVDGDHDWSVWARTVDDALLYIAPHLRRPEPLPR